FPAITICPYAKSRADVFNLTHALELLKNDSVLSEDSFVPCRTLLADSLVNDGFCHTFNALAANETYRVENISPDFLNLYSPARSSDWTPERGYRRHAGLKSYPHRPLTAGFMSGMMIGLGVRKSDQEAACQGPYTGYKFAVHAPNEFPLTEDQFYPLNTKNAVVLSLRPKVFWTSPHLKAISSKKRQCFFSNERYLHYFRAYNVGNCIAECASNFTYKVCGCVRFSLPRSPDMKVCDSSQILCYRKAFMTLFKSYIENAISNRPQKYCTCYPSCNKIDYTVEISQLPFHFEKVIAVTSFPTELYTSVDVAVLFVSFKDRHLIPVWKRELMGVTDAIAKVGGLFALLMGASVLSVGEILYYCCIRPLRRVHQPRPADNDRQVRLILPWEPPHRQIYVPQRWMQI
ncbi:pickpocket protein 28-like, partial [Malaya genurostris]|uniref:pickpocket protein 28-like n=1 Tax=Malaya genurostris TaxID=325434 RepID=UPI0026F3D15A